MECLLELLMADMGTLWVQKCVAASWLEEVKRWDKLMSNIPISLLYMSHLSSVISPVHKARRPAAGHA